MFSKSSKGVSQPCDLLFSFLILTKICRSYASPLSNLTYQPVFLFPPNIFILLFLRPCSFSWLPSLLPLVLFFSTILFLLSFHSWTLFWSNKILWHSLTPNQELSVKAMNLVANKDKTMIAKAKSIVAFWEMKDLLGAISTEGRYIKTLFSFIINNKIIITYLPYKVVIWIKWIYYKGFRTVLSHKFRKGARISAFIISI